MKRKNDLQSATFGAGCFWGVEYAFRKIPGVVKTTVGFMGGRLRSPSYEKVCSENTGHAEVMHVKYDKEIVSYGKLLEVFWDSHDPTQFGRQGSDIGDQYRSVIFFHDENQKEMAEKSRGNLAKSKKFGNKIATVIVKATEFYKAEEYHQNYLKKQRRSSCHI